MPDHRLILARVDQSGNGPLKSRRMVTQGTHRGGRPRGGLREATNPGRCQDVSETQARPTARRSAALASTLTRTDGSGCIRSPSRRLVDRQFKKYQAIECLATTPRGDNRPESLRVDQDSITFVGDSDARRCRWWRRRYGRSSLTPDMSLGGDPGRPNRRWDPALVCSGRRPSRPS